MSQLVLDDQLDVQKIRPALKTWITAVRLQDLRPGEHILDERVPEILGTLKKPTFVTIDHGFWKRRLSHSDYCILYFDLAKDEQQELRKWFVAACASTAGVPHARRPHGQSCPHSQKGGHVLGRRQEKGPSIT